MIFKRVQIMISLHHAKTGEKRKTFFNQTLLFVHPPGRNSFEVVLGIGV